MVTFPSCALDVAVIIQGDVADNIISYIEMCRREGPYRDRLEGEGARCIPQAILLSMENFTVTRSRVSAMHCLVRC